jgi:adenine-specific DNA-methyltransferase
VTDQALRAYEYQDGWVNRMILGDSLVVMNSLLHYENLGGQVQMIYMDPPYGVRFGSNFQPFVRKRDVTHGDDEDFTREPEMVQAYRDTWELGMHSYLAYLRDRALLARELLAPGGSLFVQISEDNVHHVRETLDEVFGFDNFVCQIVVKKTGGLGSSGIKSIADYLLWFSKDAARLKYHPLLQVKRVGIGEGTGARYDQLESPDGNTRRPMTGEERESPDLIPSGWRPYQFTSLTSGAFRENTTVPYTFNGEVFHPGPNACWKTTTQGLDRLARLNITLARKILMQSKGRSSSE